MKICAREGCDNPVKNSRSKYCSRECAGLARTKAFQSDRDKKLEEEAMVKKWEEMINRAKAKRSAWKADADESIKIFMGHQWTDDEVRAWGSDDVSVTNKIGATVEIMSSAIFNKDPVVICRPKFHAEAGGYNPYDQADLIQNLLNYWWRELGLKPKVKKGSRNALVMGQCFLKMGYTKKIKELYGLTTDPKTGIEFEPGKLLQNYNEDRLIEEHIWIDLVDGRKMLIDSNATDMNDARWVGEETTIELGTILYDDDTYPPNKKIGLISNLNISQEVARPEYLVDVIELYDKKTNKKYLYVEGHDKFLNEEEYDFDQWEQFPYERIIFTEAPFTLYPTSFLKQIYPLQRDANRLLTRMVDHALRNKCVFTTDAMDQPEINEVNRAEHMSLLKLNSQSPIQNITAPSNVLNEQIAAFEKGNEELNRATGISEYMQAGRETGVRSATESFAISQGSQLRLQERREMLEVNLRNISRYMLKIMRIMMTKEQLVPIDKESIVQWRKLSPKEIQGEFEIQIETGSISPIDRQFGLQQFVQVLPIIQPFLESGIVHIRPFLEDVFKQIELDPSRYIKSEEQAAAEAAASQQQLEALAQENEQLRAALMKTDEMMKSGEIQVAQGPDRTSVPINELAEEVDQRVRESGEPDEEEVNELLE